MKIGIISLNGRSSKDIGFYCKKYFDQVDLLDIRDFEIRVNDELKVIHLEETLKGYDCLYIRGSYKYALTARAITRALGKEVYIPIKPAAYTLGHNKFMTLLELQKNNIAIPKTHYASTTNVAKKILETANFPIIMKLSEGTHGRGVMVAETKKSARTILDLLEDFNKPYLIQEFVTTKDTSDLRVIVAKKKVLGAYKRQAMEGEVRANIHAGGTRLKHDLSDHEVSLAIRSAEAIGADICGVDILNAESPSVIELNLSPSTIGLKDFCGVNISEAIAKELYAQTILFKKRLKKKENKRHKT